MAASIFFSSFVLNFILSSSQQTVQWYGLEPHASKPLVSMFTGIYRNQLYAIGGVENSVTTLNLESIFMNNYDGVIYQPDLNVLNAKWESEFYWYTLPFGVFCNQSCTTQINNKLYIIAPFKKEGKIISNPNTLFIYDMEIYEFISTQRYQHIIPKQVEYSCIVNNDTHIFIIGGGSWDFTSNSIILVMFLCLSSCIYIYICDLPCFQYLLV